MTLDLLYVFVCWFISTLSMPVLNVKVIGQSSRSRKENVVNSSEGIQVNCASYSSSLIKASFSVVIEVHSNCVANCFAPRGGVWCVVIGVSVCLCDSLVYVRKTKFSVHVICGRSSGLLWRQCIMSCTSTVVNNIVFLHNRTNGQNQSDDVVWSSYQLTAMQRAPGAKSAIVSCLVF